MDQSSQPHADDALRGTRFEFGGRRPYSFAPPRVAERAAGRPLPGIGTVALGEVSRIVPYGAFVDFLGFRGMIHVSQLLPGQHHRTLHQPLSPARDFRGKQQVAHCREQDSPSGAEQQGGRRSGY